MKIVAVKFQSKDNPGEYGGRDYNYFVKDGIDLREGDVVQVDTVRGPSKVKVSRTGISESQVDERVWPMMKVITSGPIAPEEVQEAAQQ
jgi:hypothetical protein